jgi:hypothetical protein
MSGFYFVKELTKKTKKEIYHDVSQNYNFGKNIVFDYDESQPKKETATLPFNAINLSDPIQQQYYRDETVVQDALRYISDRRLNTAINQTTFYLSLVDYIHANRLIIPFLDLNKKILFYFVLFI